VQDSDPNANPFNPLPPVVIALAVVIAGIELLFAAAERGFIGGPGAIGWRLAAIQAWGFVDVVFDWMIQNRRFPPGDVARLVTYPLLHVGFSHALFVVVFVLALGKMVGEAFRGWAVLAVFFGASVGGALAYGLLLDDRVALAGGFPGVYGLIGAFTYILWMRLSDAGAKRYRAFALVGLLLAVQLLFQLFFGGHSGWVADLSGFVTGFLMSFVVSPGGPARLRGWLARARRR